MYHIVQNDEHVHMQFKNLKQKKSKISGNVLWVIIEIGK